MISVDKETGEYKYGFVYVDAVRGLRAVGDDIRFVKHDKPLIMTQEKAMIDELQKLETNDIVFVKGVITSKKMQKPSYCECTDPETGEQTINKAFGNLIYVTPIYMKKVKSYGEDKKAAIQDIVDNREISNQAYVFGTLITEPKLFTTKNGKQITQYVLATDRKYLIRTDDPSIKTDWPVVKSYGEQARNDKIYLKYQADIFIDGFLQARKVKRKTKCRCCGKIYEWEDRAMEIVPYAVEYLNGQRSKDEVEAEFQKSVEDIKQDLFNSGYNDDMEEGLHTSELDN